MKLYVGITDSNWFNQLAAMRPDEVNFWKPGGKAGFSALDPGGLFLFKLHSPHNFIVGGGFFVRFTRLPVSLTWDAFGSKNGVTNIEEFKRRIQKYRKDVSEQDPTIGSVILNQPFFFDQNDWIPAPQAWPANVVQGKTYDTNEIEGMQLYADVIARLSAVQVGEASFIAEDRARYSEPYLERARLGQGAFRVLVTDAYDRRCSITGERTLPVLQAAHIKPYSEDGPNHVNNGMLLRADLHILFDQGLLTVTPEHIVEVSDQIRERFENGRDYYALRGQKLKVLPARATEHPSEENLRWHNERFVA